MATSNPRIALDTATASAVAAYRPIKPSELAWRRFRRNKAGVLGLIIVVLLAAFAIVGSIALPFPDTDVINSSLAPGDDPAHPLGTDIAGRDMVGLLAWGTRTSLMIAVAAQIVITAVALVLGFTAAWFRGVADYIVLRLVEIATAIPQLLFQILFMIVAGNTIPNLIIALSVLSWADLTRVVRAQTLTTREREYVDAARSLGASTPSIAFRHVLPNILNPLIIAISMSIPAIILGESTLSFLGYGLTEDMPSLGKMIGVSWQYIQAFWHMALLPTLCLSLLMLGISFLGDGIRDALDPRAG
jgi:ABC-type dipeptide/oligopeptide/nickel transport system permease subunit